MAMARNKRRTRASDNKSIIQPNPSAAHLITNHPMFPRFLICGKCGESAIVVAWMPGSTDINENTGADDSQLEVVKCQIECPRCGTRIQTIKSTAE